MRFLGYVGVQFNALLVPVLVFQLSGSLALAGLALVVEWAPKVGLYALGGTLVAWLSPARAHVLLDIVRLLALAALVACAQGIGGLWAVALAAAAYQGSNAISNVLFERAISHNWEADHRSEGHARCLRQDQLACFVALLAALAVQSPFAVATLALVIQGWSLRETLAHATSLHSLQDASADRLVVQLAKDYRALCSPRLLTFGLAYLALGLPFAAANSFFVFMLYDGAASQTVTMTALATLLLARVSIALLATHWLMPLLRRSGSELVLARLGLLGALACVLALALPAPSGVLVASATAMGLTQLLTLPFLRAARQSLIAAEVAEPASRPGVTGLLSTGEAVAYLVAGGLAWGLQGHLPLLLGVSVAIGAGGAWYLTGPKYVQRIGALTQR